MIPDKEKEDAYNFLRRLHEFLNESIPSPDQMQKKIVEIKRSSKDDDSKSHTRRPEAAFLNTYIIDSVYKFLDDNVGPERSRRSLLCEYKTMRRDRVEAPMRSKAHPFSKLISASPQSIMRQWKSEKALTHSSADFALTDPFKIVFEAKYFDKGGKERAEVELVTNIYQAFFYLGLPRVAARGKKAAWDYDFACLLACDASDSGTLKAAWDDLSEAVKQGFWDGANVYVMILRGVAHA